MEVVWTPVLRKWANKWTLSPDLVLVFKLSEDIYVELAKAIPGPSGFTTPKKKKLEGLDL